MYLSTHNTADAPIYETDSPAKSQLQLGGLWFLFRTCCTVGYQNMCLKADHKGAHTALVVGTTVHEADGPANPQR
jgi:hypothetical protein